MRLRILAYAALVLLMALPALAEKIYLRQLDGTFTEWAGTGSAADMNIATLLECEDQTNKLCMVSGGAVRFSYLGTGLTTDTTTAAITLPVGSKSIYGVVSGTGAITQTQKIYSGVTSGFTPATDGILLCTLTLSDTTPVDQCPVITAPGLFYKAVTSNTTGTGTTGVIIGMY